MLEKESCISESLTCFREMKFLSFLVCKPLVCTAHVIDEFGVTSLGCIGAGILASYPGGTRKNQCFIRAWLGKAANTFEVVLVEFEDSFRSEHRQRESVGIWTDFTGHGNLVFL